MNPAAPASTGMFVATGPIYSFRCAGQDIETRPAWYASLFDRSPALGREVVEFSRRWRGHDSALALCALMARRPGPDGLDPVAYLRAVGRDVRERPETWARIVAGTPELRRDLVHLSHALRGTVAASAAPGEDPQVLAP
ncbi:hypothetical protein BURK1_02571 [Burkholderiales bacterium]|nr:hypothetical protein BURK1_02571 [Burkholderiales bacterium]